MSTCGTLYVVATPLGNLGDFTPRAAEVLSKVACIAAEDTRHSGKLMRHFGIDTGLQALHEHNERSHAEALLDRLERGDDIALISDAGTPLISDPGFRLVRGARERGIEVVAVPGPCAAIAALSVAGLACDRFVFEGFLPAKGAARRERIRALRDETRTLIFYESPHRIEAMLADLASELGGGRHAVLARELTKAFETVLDASLDGLIERLAEDPNQRRGEMVVLVAGAEAVVEGDEAAARRVLEVLLPRLAPREAAAAAAELTGLPRNRLYRMAMEGK